MIIAIASRLENIDDQYKYFVNKSYIDVIEKYHHTPLILHSIDEQILEICDALIVPGGYDILSFYFNQSPNAKATFYKQPQDYFDFAIIDAFVQAKKPILGICRGLQLLNVYFRGTLLQHIETSLHETEHQHSIKILSNTFLSTLYGPTTNVNSYHHQVLDKLGNGFSACAWSMEGYVEAAAHETLPIIAVQWHPEKMEDDRIFSYFFNSLMHTPL